MPHGKAHRDDPRNLRDETCALVERAAALSRLVSDERREFEPYIVTLLTHDEPLLRAAALLALAGRWRLERYFEVAFRLLTEDPDWLVRSNAAHALSMYACRSPITPQKKHSVLRALALSVQTDPDAGVKEAAYRALLQILERPVSEYFHASREFDLRRDVNWELLRPYLAQTDGL